MHGHVPADCFDRFLGSSFLHQIEHLWKKRFGMLLTPIEKVKLYLKHPEDWENSPSQEDKKYYKFAPEYTIEHTFEPEDHRDGYEYYLFAQTDSRPHWCDIRICYHQTVLADMGGVILDGGRYFTATPNTDGISLNRYAHWDVAYKYMIKGELNHLVHEFYYVDDGDEARHAHNEYEGCLLFFDSLFILLLIFFLVNTFFQVFSKKKTEKEGFEPSRRFPDLHP